MLCLCLAVSAAAETTVREISARDVELSRYTGVMAIREKNSDTYVLFSPSGEKLTDGQYTSMYATDYGFFKVEAASEDGVHNDGLIDSTGRVLIPPEYADISVVSSRWQVGIKLVPCEADDKDYTFSNWSTNEKLFFRIDTVDFFLDGEKAGSLSRADYDGYPTAHGAYICVQNRERQRFWYDRTMSEGRPAQSSSEYETQYKNRVTTYTHNGSGQTAFAPGCTLTPEDVDQSVVYENGHALDLQGNVLYDAKQNYDSNRPMSGGAYCRVKIYGKWGVIDREMNEVIPLEYDEISYEDESLSRFGYIGAVKDGKFGFVNAAGEVTCPFVYAKDIVSNKGTFATIKNLDGTIIVLSAAAGELPEHYAEVSVPGYSGSMSFTARNASGERGAVGLYGNVLVPFSADNRSISLSADGRIAVVSKGGYVYEIYHFDDADLFPADLVNGAGEHTEKAPETPETAAGDTWTCANGHEGNTGKFCTECGSPRPAAEDDGTWTCANGHEGNTGKFCSECGSPKP